MTTHLLRRSKRSTRQAIEQASLRCMPASNARLAAVLRLSSDLTTIVSADGRVEYQNPASVVMLAIDPAKLTGRSFEGLLHDDDRELWAQALEAVQEDVHTAAVRTWRLRRSDDTYVLAQSSIRNLLHKDDVGGIVLTTRELARRDAISPPLPFPFGPETERSGASSAANRAKFICELERAVASLDPSDGGVVILLADVGFQLVDGSWEEVSADLVDASGARLHEALRRGETLALLREHEFGILAEGADERYARALVDRVQSLFSCPFGTERSDVYVHCNFGVAISRDPSERVVDLLRRADQSRYTGDLFEEEGEDVPAVRPPTEGVDSSDPGRASCDVGDFVVAASVNAPILFVDLVPDVAALERGELTVLYRPIYNLSTGEVVALETRPQWAPSTGFSARPIDVASVEMNGSTTAIERWLLRTACHEARAIRESAGIPELSVRVPVFPRQLEAISLLDHVALALGESGLPAENLVMEVPESAASGTNRTARSLVDGLKALGVRIAVTDFHSEAPSADYLRALEVDQLNLPCPLHPEIRKQGSGAGSFLPRLAEIAFAIGLEIVVEGVDTFSQVSQVLQAGIRLAQGMILGTPIDAQLLAEILSGEAHARVERAG
jgi:EAL domain-containing protein (putative c-di-GMP-specific phosphodiesterase class I)/GGDEF domain-containing protein